jgi:kynurenine 3-monooxygenase
MKIVVVGAGLVGSLWAVMLRKKGHEVHVIERRKDPRKAKSGEDRSINLVITSRGLKGLNEAGLLKQAILLSVPIFGRMIHSKNGETAFQAYGSTDECNFSISRSELNKFLLNSADQEGAKIHFEQQILDADFEKKEVLLGSEKISYDLLFGTDGAGSQVRQLLAKKYPDQFQEHTEWLDADYKELSMPATSAGNYQLQANALHIWPRGSHMMMALANLDGSFTMTLYMPKQSGAVSFANMNSAAEIDQLFSTEFADAKKLMPQFLQEFQNHPQGRLGTVRCSKWTYKDSVALMGDAAHAIVPFFGQGMNSGFEDCTILNQLLAEKSVAEALNEYEVSQKKNARAIGDMAIENWTEMRDKVGDSNFLLRKKVEAQLEARFSEFFKSRYGMVTYTQIPYALAQAAGAVQGEILDQLCSDKTTIEEVDFKLAQTLVKEKLEPFNRKHKLNLNTDPLVANTRREFSS